MNTTDKKKMGKGWKIFLAFLAVWFIISVIASIKPSSEKGPNIASNTAPSSAAGENDKKETKETVDYYSQAKTAFEAGRLTEAKELIQSALKNADDQECQELSEEITQAIELRKEMLFSSFDVDEDKVENITFIKPKDAIQSGLICYPYIGVKDSRKYMLLRIGYQEPADKTMIAFTGIKIRTDDELRELSFNPMNKKSNIDIFGTGITEVIDIVVKKDIMTLLDTDIPNASDVYVRFDSITNERADYELTDEQKQIIADILEYYGYMEEAE